MKYFKFALCNMLFPAMLLLIYWLHITFFKVNVVFYSAIIDGILATFVTILLVSLSKWLNVFSVFEKFQLVLFWLLLGYAYAISIPTVIDRSLSFYTLEKLQQRGGGIQLSAFERVYANEYMKEHRLVDVRLTEQQQSGTIKIQNGCVVLTEWGNTLATASRFFRNHFLPKQRLLMGEYSSDLTDPFKKSDSQVDYLCK
jgi:hypothetical protein